MNFFSIFPLFSYIGYIATIQGVSVRAECVDSSLLAIFDGSLPFYGATCAQISDYGANDNQLSDICTSQRLDQHCPVLCQSCVSGCEDSDAIFEVNGEPTTCADIVDDHSKCNILGVSQTCKEVCSFCPEPVNITALVLLVNELEDSNNELSAKVNVLEDSNNELSAKINVLEDSQKRICEDVSADNTYIEGYGCFPVTYRDSEEMIYIMNSVELEWEAHEQAAILCGGHLASIIDENEQAKVASFIYGNVDRFWIGGVQQQPCFDEPAGCWVWSDGNELSITNWLGGNPSDSNGEDCMQILGWHWNDRSCDVTLFGVYILPPTFDSSSNCNITIA